MSLEIYAKHLAEKGRGPDDTLVHMSRDEVRSLNDLAMAHGGQLTINPETGLPEAGFLSSLLPMVAGAALTGLSGGAINPLTAGLIVGGGTMLAGGSLQKGLLAGLGAYGGGGLGGGLADLGVSSESGLTGGATGGANVSNATALENAKLAEQAKLAEATKYTSPNYLDVGGTGANYLPTGSGGLDVQSKIIGADYENVLPKGNLLENPLTGSQLPPQPGITDRLANMYQGAKSIVTDPTAEKFKELGGGSWTGLAKMGLAAAAPIAAQQAKYTPLPAMSQKQTVPHYQFNPGMVRPTPAASATGVENTYFNPSYTALSNDEAAKLYPGYPAANFAGGGPVELMSNQATTGANTMYPMANMRTSAFATPYQSPQSINMLSSMAPSGGGTVDQMSGEPNMQGTRLAGGGISGSGNLDLSIPLDFGGAGGGGFGGGGVNGYSAVGSGGGNQTPFAGQNNTGPNSTGINAARDPGYQQIQQLNGRTPFDNTIEGDTFQPVGTHAFGGNPQQMIGLLSSLMQGKPAGNASAQMASGGMATGGISDAHYNLGGYSDGGRLLRGPGDGVSDSIPAVIGKKQPARLADGEFVVPARIVSELGNGSTEAGARRLYAMMDRIQAARSKTVGKGKVAKNTKADKYLPA